MRSLAMDGRWVLYGVMGGKAVDGDLLGKLLSVATFSVVFLGHGVYR